MNVSRYRHSYTALGLCVLSALGVPWAGADEPPLLDTISREFSVNVGDPNAPNPVTDAISREFSVNVGDPNAAIPVRDAISREFSVNVGDPNAPIRVSDVISREFSVNVGDPSAPIPVREAISREFSVNVGDPASYVPVTDAVSREFSVYVPVPDLTITSLTAPSSVGVGESLSIEWDLANIGHKAATGPWQDCLYLSSDNTLGNDTQLDCYSHSEALEPGNTSTVTLNVMTPAVTPGTYWLIAQADQAYAISEVDEQNNTRVFGPIKVLPTLIPTEEASSNIIPAFGGDGLALELYLGIGGGGAPRPADLANRIPDGAFLAPYLDFPNPGSTVQISSNFTQFFANTIVPPDAVRDLQPQRFTLRSSTLLKVTAAEDRDPATPEIDLEIGVGSDDGYYLEVGNRFQGQAGDRGFSYSWHALRFESEGLYPLDLLFAANNSGFSGLELAWRTRSGESKIPQDALYRAAPGCDTLVEFDDFDPGTVLENQLSGQGLIFEALSGQPQVTDVRPGDFVPVSGTRVLADPRENPSEEVVLELRFVDPATGSNAVTNYFSCYVIDAEEIGATATVYNSLGEVLESRSFNLGGASQEFAAFSHPGMNRIVFNLGQGADTAALDNLCFTTPMPYNPADLQLQEIAIPAEVAPGEAVELSWTVANIGKGIARASWTDRVYLSPDSRAGDDIFLGETIRAADLAADESYVQSATLAIPDVADGNYFIVVVADAEGAVPDLNRGNNSSVVGTLSVSRPDLSTTLSTIPTYAAPESHIIVEWQVENHGDIRSRHAWSDCVYLSTDNTPGNDTLVACLPRPNDLAIGESYANSQSIQLPVVSEGHYWLYVVADGEDVVPEHNNEDNRSALLPIAIARTNLTPASINSQSVTSPSQVIGVEWFVENASIVEASASWRDGIYLSADDVAGNDTFLANFERPAPSDAGATYYQTQNVTLPDVPEGQYWLVLVTDDANVIAESDESDNVELFGPILITRVDLKSTIQGIDPQSPKSEGPVTISWNVENLSEALALYDWQDCVYLSSDAAIGDDTLLACIDNGDLLGGGASYESQLEVTLPALEAGNYWFVVKADGNDFVPESDEVNNSSIVGPFEIRVVLPPLIEPIDDQTAAQGQPFTGPAPVLTQGTAPVTWSLLQGPAGMTIEEETGVVSWEAPTEDFVPYTVVIRAANEAGSADAHWSVNVPLSYTATVMTDVSIVPAGTPIPLVGDATMVATGEPAPNKPVTVRVLVQDTRRVINVTTDENGAFETVFTPIPREGGFYAIGADHPLVPTDKSDDIFSIASMHLSPETLAVQLAPGTPVDEAVTLHNNGDEPLSGLAYELADAPQGVIVTLDAMPATLPAKAALPLTVHLLGLAPTSQPVEATLRIHSAEGTVATARLTMDVRPNTPQLVASPVSLDAGMVVGEQTLVETLLTNTGGAETGALEVVLPQSTWLSLSTPTLITSIEPGETRGVTISLTPPLDHVLGPYKGYYRVAGAQSNLTVPFTFTAVSEGKGDLKFTVVDEFTYFAEDKPPVAGAEIRLSNPYTGEPVEYVDPETGEPGTAVTGPDGTFTFHQLPEGYYEAAVSAPGHTFHRGAYRVPALGTEEVQVFLSRQLVSYTWNVTPTQIADEYDVSVDVTFETHVPAPVVTIEPAFIDLRTMNGPVAQYDLTFSNHGLINAEELKLQFTSTSRYIVIPLVENLGTLPPLTSFVVPVIVYDTTFGTKNLSPNLATRINEEPFATAGVIQNHKSTAVLPTGSGTWDVNCPGNNKKHERSIGFLGNGLVEYLFIGDGERNLESTPSMNGISNSVPCDCGDCVLTKSDIHALSGSHVSESFDKGPVMVAVGEEFKFVADFRAIAECQSLSWKIEYIDVNGVPANPIPGTGPSARYTPTAPGTIKCTFVTTSKPRPNCPTKTRDPIIVEAYAVKVEFSRATPDGPTGNAYGYDDMFDPNSGTPNKPDDDHVSVARDGTTHLTVNVTGAPNADGIYFVPADDSILEVPKPADGKTLPLSLTLNGKGSFGRKETKLEARAGSKDGPVCGEIFVNVYKEVQIQGNIYRVYDPNVRNDSTPTESASDIEQATNKLLKFAVVNASISSIVPVSVGYDKGGNGILDIFIDSTQSTDNPELYAILNALDHQGVTKKDLVLMKHPAQNAWHIGASVTQGSDQIVLPTASDANALQNRTLRIESQDGSDSEVFFVRSIAGNTVAVDVINGVSGKFRKDHPYIPGSPLSHVIVTAGRLTGFHQRVLPTFTFGADINGNWLGVSPIGETMAHELMHSLGLDDLNDPSNLMHYDAASSNFGNQPLRYFSLPTQQGGSQNQWNITTR